MKRINLILIVIVVFLASWLPAQAPSEYAGMASNIFLRTELSTRASALGGAFTAVADDENSIFYNPAGLAQIHKGALALNHTQWFEDISMENIIFGYSFDRKLGIGISFSHMWMPTLQGRNHLGESTGNFDVSSSVVTLGIGYKVHRSFYAGVAIKYFQDNLAEFKADGMAIDLGVYLYTAIRGLTFGLSVQNLGSEIQYDVENEQLPFTYRAGLAYKPFGNLVHIAADVVRSIDYDFYYTAGIEFTYEKAFSLRVGNQFKNQEQLFQPSYGAGLNIADQYLVDYTFYQNNNLGNTHKIGFTFKFNLPATKRTSDYRRGSSRITKILAPQHVDLTTFKEEVVVKWSKVFGARYNVYVRASKDQSWIKMNKSPLYSNQSKFKMPKKAGKYYIVITSIINNVESSYSKEAVLDVKDE